MTAVAQTTGAGDACAGENLFLAVMMPMPRRAWLAPAVPAATAPLRRGDRRRAAAEEVGAEEQRGA